MCVVELEPDWNLNLRSCIEWWIIKAVWSRKEGLYINIKIWDQEGMPWGIKEVILKSYLINKPNTDSIPNFS